MLNSDQMLGSLYLLMALMLVLGGLMNRRARAAKLLVMAMAWIAIFGAGFVLFTFRDDLGYLAQRLRTEATGAPVRAGETLRIPMAIDGHFWVDGSINGHQLRFLVDSGATVTTIGEKTARRSEVEIDPGHQRVVRTGNGLVRVGVGRAERLAVGPIERRNQSVHVAQGEELAVLGMNFLSSLDRWGVEGRWLILEP